MDLEKKKDVIEKILREHTSYSDELVWNLLSFVDDHFVHTDEFACPECHAQLQIHIVHKVKRIVAPSGEIIKGQTLQPLPAKHPLADTPLAVAMDDAYSKLPAAYRPKNIPEHLQTFIERALPLTLPKPAHRLLLDHYGSPKIAAYCMGNMAIVLVDGEFRQFIPVPILKGLAVAALTTNGAEIAETKKPYTSEAWIKTRFGYVAERGYFFDELRKKSVGDFAK